MGRVAVVTDSTSCLPLPLAQEYGIEIVPLSLLFGEELYYDRSMPSDREFFSRLREARQFPTTAAASPGAFLEAFRRVSSRGDDAVLCITMASQFSSTYSAALQAAELAREEMPGLTVHVLDSGSISMGLGFAVLAAARAADKDGMEGAAAAALMVVPRAYAVAALDTLSYLAKGGRVPKVAAWATSLLQVKPILQYHRGQVGMIERVRSRRRVLERLLELMNERIAPGEPLHVSVVHADAADDAQSLAQGVKERFHPQELYITEFSQVMAVHTGPGAIGLAFYSGS